MQVDRRTVLRRAGGAAAAVALTAVGAGAGAAAATHQDRAAHRRRADAVGGPEPRRPGSVRVLWHASTDEPLAALTFDDGPVERFTRPVLDLLEDRKVPATFAVVGERVLEQEELVRREVSGRHELVNHTWSHADLCLLDRDAVGDEVDRLDDLLQRLTGRRPSLLRPPYGRVTGTVLEVAAERGHDVLLWDTRLHERSGTPDEVARMALDQLRPGCVLLGHDGGRGPHEIGLAALPAVIDGARARGFRFVTASELHATP